MPKRSRKKKSRDINMLASNIVSQATGQDTPRVKPSTLETLGGKPIKNPCAVELGRLGGKKGGKAKG
jgi:hypothetical protein